MIYSFGDYRLDATAFEVWRSGKRIGVEPQVLELLLLLIENRNRIVTRDEIFEKIWNGRIVSEATLSSRMSSARQLLGDTGRAQSHIRTIHGRGFRFVAHVRVDLPTGPAGSAALSPHPTTRYARSGDVHIAYHLFGDGKVDLVLTPGFVSHIENFWDDPNYNRWLTKLGRIARVAMFDKRGTGLSDPVSTLPGMDERMDDVRAVMDAVGFEKAVIMGVSEGGSLASLYAASHPERSTGLVLYGAFAQFTSWFPTDESLRTLFDYIETGWGTGNSVANFAPSMADDPDFRRWWGKFERLGATPGAAIALMRMNSEIDISGILSSISVPTLVIHRTGDVLIDVDGGRFLASHIPGARLVELPGRDHLAWVGDNCDRILDEVDRFLAGCVADTDAERVLATILFVQPDGGSSQARTPGSDTSDERIRSLVRRYRGSSITKAANGCMARFDGPARALRCSVDIAAASSEADDKVRIAIHTGEVRLVNDTMEGLATDIAMSVAERAGPNEIVVSRTVKDLVAGSGIRFEDIGGHRLARINEVWRLYRVVG